MGINSSFSISVERKDLGITHKDFRRVFPRVCGPWGEVVPLLEVPDKFLTDFESSIAIKVTNKSAGKEIVVKVSDERLRKIGRLKFPYIELVFWFAGFERAESESFMQRFDTAFQKGGG